MHYVVLLRAPRKHGAMRPRDGPGSLGPSHSMGNIKSKSGPFISYLQAVLGSRGALYQVAENNNLCSAVPCGLERFLWSCNTRIKNDRAQMGELHIEYVWTWMHQAPSKFGPALQGPASWSVRRQFGGAIGWPTVGAMNQKYDPVLTDSSTTEPSSRRCSPQHFARTTTIPTTPQHPCPAKKGRIRVPGRARRPPSPAPSPMGTKRSRRW